MDQRYGSDILSGFEELFVDMGDGTFARRVATTAAGAPSQAAIAAGQTANSSAVPLGVGATFTGAWVDVSSLGSIIVNAFANVASGTNGLVIQQSSDGVNADFTDSYTVPAGAPGIKVIIPVQAKFARVVYTNGGTLQTTFRMQALLSMFKPTASALKPADGLSLENDFSEVIAASVVYNGTTLDMLRSAVNGANSTGTGIMAAGLMAQFDDVSVTAITENNFGHVRMSADHILYVAVAPSGSAGAGLNGQQTTVVGGSIILKAAAGNLYGFEVTSGASAGYLMVFDSATVPADGVVTPKRVYAVAANATFARQLTEPLRMAAGIVLVFSTTGPFTKTISATAFLAGDYV